MVRLALSAIATVFAVLALAGSDARDLSKRESLEIHFQSVQTNDILKWLCQESPFAPAVSFCQMYTTTKAPATSTPSSSTTMGSMSTTGTTTAEPETTSATDSPSALERAHWCRFANGSYLTRGQTFMHTECQLCQCTQSRVIRCVELQCMATYCIDNTVPSRKPGQCCSQCAYETNTTECVQNGITFPHGTIVKASSDKVYCWCQLGSIECRKMGVSVFSGMDLWGEGTAVYIIVIIMCVLLIIGTLLCGGCSLFYYYYYYYYNQQSAEQTYWENAGWQPMGEEEQVVDAEAEKKQAEAEAEQSQDYPAGLAQEYIPPPYALYNGAYESEQAGKEQKYL